ncbi:ATP-binding protein [Sphingomonas sp. AR_OL41]|uniref:AAA family ATPase n=1 Tax=Sphingomonas sp. AR_OL41 TaxID=3042729 RepID=UPI002480BB06|nr:ATP-binding protein [Sphingomonas sp. AR_OL41]MDH7974976.1 ATP-binding protein [Sphingomonas sp. AR_OL41]
MTSDTPILHLLCGKVAAGKSTLAGTLAADGALLVAQDPWMARLYPTELRTIDDYLRLSARLRHAMTPHLVALLRAGLSLVLDWPANTVASRRWMREIADAAGATARLHWLDVPDRQCLTRLDARNAGGAHEFTVSHGEFAELARLFEPPGAEEGLPIVRHAPG